MTPLKSKNTLSAIFGCSRNGIMKIMKIGISPNLLIVILDLNIHQTKGKSKQKTSTTIIQMIKLIKAVHSLCDLFSGFYI